jgi:hypothetical protein
MFQGNDSLPVAVHTALERDLEPLLEESVELLALDRRQAREMAISLQAAWFFGVRTGHRVMVDTKMGQEGDPLEVIDGMQPEFRSLMEDLGDALNTTVSATMQAWEFLGQAWMAGAEFWEVEIAARLIEGQTGGFGEILRRWKN